MKAQETYGEQVYTVAEVARIFRLSASAVRRLIRRGEIPAIHLGRTWHIPKSVVDALFAQPLLTTFTPQDIGFGSWRDWDESTDSVTLVNQMRRQNARTLRETLAELEQ